MTGGPVLLDAVQARVLAVLVEKRYTVPDTYPLSLLSLVSGCNQRSSRDPVMDLSEVQVQGALDALRLRSFVIESSGSRVMRYAENIGPVLGVPREAVALLAVLMLRGPQTAAELRLHSERLHRFADVSSVEAFLEELANRGGQAFVRRLPVQPGSREARWTHTLTPSPVSEAPVFEASEPLVERLARLEQQVDALQGEVAALRAVVSSSFPREPSS